MTKTAAPRLEYSMAYWLIVAFVRVKPGSTKIVATLFVAEANLGL